MVEPALAAELNFLVADVFQIIESWMERRGCCPAQRSKNRASRSLRRVEKRPDGMCVGFAEADLVVVLRLDSQRRYQLFRLIAKLRPHVRNFFVDGLHRYTLRDGA